jgi:hypothetical protein
VKSEKAKERDCLKERGKREGGESSGRKEKENE